MARLLKKPLVIALAAVILLVIGFFAYIQNAFTGKKIAGDLETAKSSRESALALQAEYEEKLRSIDKEAEAILDEARKKAKKQEAEILEEARAEAGRILERASREIDLEKKKALEDVKTEIVSIASLMAGKAVAASMDVKIQDLQRSRYPFKEV